MDKDNDKVVLANHNITITERQSITISGITKIDSFDSEEFLLETSAGPLGIKGRELEIVKLDTYDGTIMIKGVIDGFSYLDAGKTKKEDSVISRLFK
jgi:sporulation protein YabP